ncbi:MAG TPA: Gfo/Idh/MocA family oxidoreductase [Phycisphaerae bacterium]|nr:Gfo/Idh/MocA family oxidoreductase [Phycisphaerae bacterium]HOJ72964.1 Gfo/Idh/MocA family oxidoreductase [Phycisphaerae bacterium]HOM50148.1 Gfo/Idh/MocA family oxidoreductase [Phycisphaerae bacterium]HON69304.1 Gfo/Idh/MocA family oxidoreductase [Phycisphaerae bacterium]HOQ84333.1 Gfo/Idh/MocA family oxidoreductase [Phycisphaerae bacterium]
MSKPIPVAVVGTGHMGRHHVRVYHEMPETQLVGIVDLDLKRAQELADTYQTQAYDSIEPLLGKVQAVSVAVPTMAHLQVARPFIETGAAVLIEKPLAPDSETGRLLHRLAREHNALLQVGHTERFNPVVRALHRMEVAPKFIETHRISPFTFRSADIGVVMDMMIHDIDVVLSLVRAKPVQVEAVGVRVLARHEDVANAWVTFDNGCVANLTASRLALKTERKIRVFSEEAYLSLDYQKKNGIAVKKDANLDLLKLAREHDAKDLSQLAGVDFSQMVKVEPLQVDDVEPLRAELQSFITALQSGRPPEVSAEDGVAAIELAEQIVAALKRHQWELSDTN